MEPENADAAKEAEVEEPEAKRRKQEEGGKEGEASPAAEGQQDEDFMFSELFGEEGFGATSANAAPESPQVAGPASPQPQASPAPASEAPPASPAAGEVSSPGAAGTGKKEKEKDKEKDKDKEKHKDKDKDKDAGKAKSKGDAPTKGKAKKEPAGAEEKAEEQAAEVKEKAKEKGEKKEKKDKDKKDKKEKKKEKKEKKGEGAGTAETPHPDEEEEDGQADEEGAGPPSEGSPQPPSPEPGTAAGPLQPGQAVEAKYGDSDSFYDAEVVGPGEAEGTIKVRYKYDGSEVELPSSDVRAKAELQADAKMDDGTAAPAAADRPFEVGEVVKAKFGGSFFDATITEITAETVKVTYKYDGSEAELPKSEVQHADAEAEAAPADPEAAAAEAAAKAAEEEEWADAEVVDIGWEAAAQLLDNYNTLSQLAERMSGARLRAEESGTVRLRGPVDEELDGPTALAAIACARCLIKVLPAAALAAKAGTWTAEGVAPPAEGDAGKHCSAVPVPTTVKDTLLGAIEKLTTDHGVVAAFQAKPKAVEPESTEPPAPLEVGQAVEAKYGDSFHEAEVLEISEETVKVKYKYDSSEADLPKDQVKPKAASSADGGGEAKPAELKEGDVVEAKYGDSFFEAEVLEVTADGAKVKYKYDSSEATVTKDDIKVKPALPENELLYVWGEAKGRAACKLDIFKALVKGGMGMEIFEGMKDDPLDDHGLTVIQVPTPGKCIGPKGSMVKRMMAIAAVNLAVPGDKDTTGNRVALISGPGEERRKAAFLVELTQMAAATCTSVAECLNQNVRFVQMPDEAVPKLMGKKREAMNTLEQELEFISITMAPGATIPGLGPAAPDEPFEPVADAKVEAKYSNSWAEATIVEVLAPEEGEAEGKVKVKWGYDNTSESEVLRSELRPILEGEAKEARDRADALANYKVLAVFASPDKVTPAAMRIMALVEAGFPGTYIGQDGGQAAVALSDEDKELLAAEVEAVKKAEEQKQWEEQQWKEKEDEKWKEEQKWAGGGEEKKWGQDSGGGDSWGKQEESSWSKPEEKSWGGGGGGGGGNSWDKPEEKSWDAPKQDAWGKQDWEQKEDKWGGGGGGGGGGSGSQWGEQPKQDQWSQPAANSWDAPKEQSWEQSSGGGGQSWSSGGGGGSGGGDDSWGAKPDAGASWGGGGSSGSGGGWGEDQRQAQQGGDWGAKRGWGGGSESADKRPRVEAPGPGAYAQAAPSYSQPEPAQVSGPCDTYARLLQYGMPSTKEEWTDHQAFFFEGYSPLPPGWIRVWSKSKNREYFMRPADNHTTFDINEVA